jgi:hypothetical protein
MAASIGYFFGMFFAAAGIGYIWLALLSVSRLRKAWPRAAHWSAIAVTAFIGGATALQSQDALVSWLATLAAVAFMVWRGRANDADSKAAA